VATGPVKIQSRSDSARSVEGDAGTARIWLLVWLAVPLPALVFALAVRGSMRVAAIVDGRPVMFTADGSVGLVSVLFLFSAALGMMFIVFAGAHPAAWWRKGLVFGGLLFVFPMLPFLLSDPEIRTVGEPLVNLFLFGLPLPVFGVGLGALVGWLDHRVPRISHHRPWVH
jgi:hypothetical protein